MSSKMMVFTGNSNRDLAKKVASRLYLELGSAKVDKFSDGEVTVELNENVRGKDVFVLQSTCEPTNDNLMELLLIIDALRRASASRITAVVPYFRLCTPGSSRAIRPSTLFRQKLSRT